MKHELSIRLENSMEQYNNHIALLSRSGIITYKKLGDITGLLINNMRVNTKGRKIGVYIEDQNKAIVAMVSIFRVGNVFIPFVPSDPYERTEELLLDVNPDVLITTVEDRNRLRELFLQKEISYVKEVVVESFVLYYFEEKEEQRLNLDSAYIYFTSGTLGKPKSILGSYQSLYQFISWEIDTFEITESIRVAQCTPISFDPFLRETLVPLCVGGSLHIPDSNVRRNPIRLKSFILKEKIQLIHTVPSLWKAILDYTIPIDDFSELKYLLLAGEMFRVDLAKQMLARDDLIDTVCVNLYGPSETTLAKFYHVLEKKDIDDSVIPVGKGIGEGTKAIVVDCDGKECLEQECGEIYIVTPYASQGYYHLDNCESKRFIMTKDQMTMYQTGDRGRINEYGELVVLGRMDNMIKLFGKKIQPEEIEQKILQYEEVKAVGITTLRNSAGEDEILCAVLCVGQNYEEEVLEEQLRKQLAAYMIPKLLFVVDKIPTNSHGKIDRRQLRSLIESCGQANSKKKTVVTNENCSNTNKVSADEILDVMHEVLNRNVVIDMNQDLEQFFDSLNYVKFIVQLEEAYDIEFEDEQLDLYYFNTLEDILNYINQD